MRSSRLALLLAVPALALGAAACGDDDENSGGATAAPAATEQDIVALAQSTPDLSTLVDAVTAADLAGTLQGDGPYTVFAPTNDAFSAVGDDTLDQLLAPAGKEQLTDVLTYHVVPGELTADALENGQELETVQGGSLRVRVSDGEVTVGGATVSQPDVEASNGVVHVIDGVLLPPEA